VDTQLRNAQVCKTGCGRDAGTIGDLQLPYCPECAAELAAQDLQEARAHALGKLLTAAGGTPMMRDWTVESYPDDEEGQRVRGYVRGWITGYVHGERHNLILFGGVGAGKTGIAWSMVRKLVEHEIDVAAATEREPMLPAAIVNWRGLLEAVRAAMRSNDEPPAFNTARHVGVLVLDDLGAERPTDFARETLANLVEHRMQQQLPIVVTTNYDPDRLAARLGHDGALVGQRIVSRLCQDAVQVRFVNGDRRREEQAA